MFLSVNDYSSIDDGQHNQGNIKYLRGEYPSVDVYYRTRGILIDEVLITSVNDYTRVNRITNVSNLPADEIVCHADPY